MFAIYKTFSDGTTQLRYLHVDNQSSLVAVTDESGNVAERLAYDPFGKRRFVTGADDPNNTISGQTTEHGYTLEEMLDTVGVINLNGRMYDPLLGRFISADPNIQSPYNMQSYNRYSYCWDNTMICTDPSGYFSLGGFFDSIGNALGGVFHAAQSGWKDLWHNEVGRLAITVAVASITQDWAATAYDASATNAIIDPIVAAGATATPEEVMAINAVQTTGAIIGGAAGGFAGGMVGSGGNLHAGVSGAISGGLFGWAGGLTPGDPWSLERYAGHALAGCVGGLASGGCERGAASAIAGQWGTNISNSSFIVTVVVGGTTSVIGGGKFANGAETAAFGYMYNGCGHGETTCLFKQFLHDWQNGFLNTMRSSTGLALLPPGFITAMNGLVGSNNTFADATGGVTWKDWLYSPLYDSEGMPTAGISAPLTTSIKMQGYFGAAYGVGVAIGSAINAIPIGYDGANVQKWISNEISK